MFQQVLGDEKARGHEIRSNPGCGNKDFGGTSNVSKTQNENPKSLRHPGLTQHIRGAAYPSLHWIWVARLFSRRPSFLCCNQLEKRSHVWVPLQKGIPVWGGWVELKMWRSATCSSSQGDGTRIETARLRGCRRTFCGINIIKC